VTNRGSGTVSVMNTDTNQVTATIRVGRAPALAAVNPLTGTIYVANFGSGTVSVITPRRG
jgi:YVTN family beta-propeller protein